MKVVVFGATGMVGAGVLIECLAHPQISSVLVVGRTSCGVVHEKLRELLRPDLLNYGDAKEDLRGYDACFFCLGTSAVSKSEADYSRITFDLTVAAAESLVELNPFLTFCYLSGEGTDSSERGRIMWARIKGKTENQVLKIAQSAYVFRPGYIHPMKGVRSRFRTYRIIHTVLRHLYPFLNRVLPTHVTTTENIGRAMIQVALGGYSKSVLENQDINYFGLAA